MQVRLFEKFLVESNLVDTADVEKYSFWIYRFLTLKLPPDIDNEEKTSRFIDTLKSDESLEDEQCAQAKYVLSIYLNDFLNGTDAEVDHGVLNSFLLVDTLVGFLQLKNYSERTIKFYLDWVLRYIDFCDRDQVQYNLSESVTGFIKHLETDLMVSASTRNQALNALSFLFVNVFDSDLSYVKSSSRVNDTRKIPEVLTYDELRSIFSQEEGLNKLMLEFIYATGITLSEFCRMRVNALDFENMKVAVFDEESFDQRSVPLPGKLVEPLGFHLRQVKELHAEDKAIGHGAARFTPGMKEKFPGQETDWEWQYLFPVARLSVDNMTGEVYRDSVAGRTVQLILKKAADAAGIKKEITVHTLRHSYATHLLMNGVSINDLQSLLGHKNVETTMIYLQVLKTNQMKPFSPLDLL